ncbi:phospholipase A [Azoarcus olearius]|uniref:Phospholipase A1 n=1 Tax=Azoarcus sp. (strain BH72) TaxID=418699 RepID=A1KAH0_AZOSB|nr:phospholipase A [Azoarcus olearius]CAL95826.1 exported protein similar to outer membrane phospholipases [Azoarcus olearius]
MSLRPCLSLLCLLVGGAAVAAPAAAPDAWLLASPEPRVVPGQPFEVIVIAPSALGEWPATLPAQIELAAPGPRIAIDLVPANVPAQGGQRRYIGHWPREVVGVATLSLREAASARLLMDAAAASRSPVEVARSVPVDAAADVAAQAPGAEPAQPAALGFHEPMYFVAGGRNPRSARYQLSFRYRIFDQQGVVAEALPVTRGLYFGFTQTSVWDLESDSKPFRDTSFRPSLFYQWKLLDPSDGASLTLAGGYEHESNGRSGLESRSIDTFFVRGDARYYFGDGQTYFAVAPKAWHYIDKDDNPDITRYRGYAELGLRFGRDDGLLLAAQLRRGTAGVGSTQLDLSYPLRRSVFSGVGAFLHLQYFNGYGETLLDYNEARSPQIRIGLSLVR